MDPNPGRILLMSSRAPAAVLGSYLTVLVPVAASQTRPPSAESPTPDRAEQMKERDRLWEESRKLRGNGKFASSIEAGQRCRRSNVQYSPKIYASRSTGRPRSPNRLKIGKPPSRGAQHWQTMHARLAMENNGKLFEPSRCHRSHDSFATAVPSMMDSTSFVRVQIAKDLRLAFSVLTLRNRRK